MEDAIVGCSLIVYVDKIVGSLESGCWIKNKCRLEKAKYGLGVVSQTDERPLGVYCFFFILCAPGSVTTAEVAVWRCGRHDSGLLRNAKVCHLSFRTSDCDVCSKPSRCGPFMRRMRLGFSIGSTVVPKSPELGELQSRHKGSAIASKPFQTLQGP